MRIIVLLMALAIATQVSAGEGAAFREWTPGSSGSFHMDTGGTNRKDPQTVHPLLSRAYEIIGANDFGADKCRELKEVSSQLMNYWINANYDVRAKINEVRSVTQKKCGKI